MAYIGSDVLKHKFDQLTSSESFEWWVSMNVPGSSWCLEMVEISGGQTTGATVPGDHCAQLQTLATSRHRVTCHAATTRANTNTFMQLLTAANHSILQGFKNVVALQYTQQLTVSSMATITYTADQLLADIPGYGNYCDAQKIAFYLRSLCLDRGSALVGEMHCVMWRCVHTDGSCSFWF